MSDFSQQHQQKQPPLASSSPTITPPPPPHPVPLQQQTGGVFIPYEEITKLFSVPIAEAAAKLGVCTSVLKRKCRENGLPKWPYRKVHAGKSIEDVKKEAALEKESRLAKQKADSSPMLSNLSSSSATQQSQDTPKFFSQISYHTTTTTTNNNYHYRTCQTDQIHPRTIPNYFDEFKYGFPSDGLTFLSNNRCWMGSDGGDGNKESNDKCDSCNMVLQSGSSRLTQYRKRGIHDANESRKRIGVCKGMLSKRGKSVLRQVFSKSLPSQWKDTFSSLL